MGFFKIPPWNHQEVTFETCKTRMNYALFYEMGAGKTGTAINIVRYKYAQNNRVMKTLILCPLAVCVQWSREWVKFGGERYDRDEVLPLVGPTKAKKLKLLDNFKGNIIIANHESLNVKEIYEWFVKWGIEIIIVDESHRFKNYGAKRTKALFKLGKGTKHRFLLTGSPILNSPTDIWAQFHFMDPGIFPDNFFVFRGQYMVDQNEKWKGKQNYFPDWQPRDDCFSSLNDVIYRFADRVLKEDCLDLPPFIRQEYRVEMTPAEKRHYKEMLDDFITWLDTVDGKKAMVANMALTKALRLQQVICGKFVPDDQGEVKRVVHHLDSNRPKVLKELLADLVDNHKVIIWTVFADTYKDIQKVCEGLGVKYAMLTGQQSQAEKQSGIDAFQGDESTRVIIANQAAGGTGVNLTASSYAIYYTRNFNLEHDIQSQARNYRGGSDIHEKVTRIDLVTPDTIDEHVLKALSQKENMAEAILRLHARRSRFVQNNRK